MQNKLFLIKITVKYLFWRTNNITTEKLKMVAGTLILQNGTLGSSVLVITFKRFLLT